MSTYRFKTAGTIGGRQLHLEEACGCMTREGEDGREIRGGEGRRSHSWFVPGPPLLEELAADLRAKVGVGPWKVSRGGTLCSKLRSGICQVIAGDA